MRRSHLTSRRGQPTLSAATTSRCTARRRRTSVTRTTTTVPAGCPRDRRIRGGRRERRRRVHLRQPRSHDRDGRDARLGRHALRDSGRLRHARRARCDYTWTASSPSYNDSWRYTYSAFNQWGEPTREVIGEQGQADIGYSLAFDADGRIVSATQEQRADDELRLRRRRADADGRHERRRVARRGRVRRSVPRAIGGVGR